MSSLVDILKAYKAVECEFLDVLVELTGCGPFDGGCVLCAHVLKRLAGGDIQVLQTEAGVAYHAVLYKDGMLVDMARCAIPSKFLAQYNRDECVLLGIPPVVSFRAIQDRDLPDTFVSEAAIQKLCNLIVSKKAT